MDARLSEQKCEVCERRKEISTCYCQYHSVAYLNLKNEFRNWESAYGEISWERYLEAVAEVDETGEWAKQVAKNELSKDRSKLKDTLRHN